MKCLNAVFMFIVSFYPVFSVQPQIQTSLYNHYNYANEESRAIVRIGTVENFSNWSISGTSNTAAGNTQWYVAKLTQNGAVVNFKLFGTPASDSCFYMTRLTRISKEHILTGHFRDPLQIPHASFLVVDSSYNSMFAFMLTNDSLGSTYRHVTAKNSATFVNTGFIKLRVGTFSPYKIIASEFNMAGGIIWARSYFVNNYSDVFNEMAYSITFQPLDSSYAITGVTDRMKPGAGIMDVFVLKLNSSGMPVWYKIYTFPPPFNSGADRIISLPDTAYAIAGFTNAPDTSRKGDIWLMKIDLNGNIKWSKLYGTNLTKEAAQCLEFNPFNNTITFGGYLLTGGNEDILGGNISNATGSLTGMPAIRNNLPGNERIYDMKYEITGAIANQLVSTGSFGNPAGFTSDLSYLRTFLNFRFPGCLSLYSVDTILVNPIIIDFPVYTEGISHIPIPMEDSVKNLVPFVECVVTGNNFNGNTSPDKYSINLNYPNPFNESTRFYYEIPKEEYVSIMIYDITGRLTTKLVEGRQPAGRYMYDFNGSSLPSGIYFCSMKAGNYTGTVKFVLVK